MNPTDPSASVGPAGRGFDELFRRSLKAYLDVRGSGIRDTARLLAGYLLAMGTKVLVPGWYTSVGAAIPGRSVLTVSALGVWVQVRPRTNDIDLFVHHEPLTASWFQVRPGDVVVDVGAHIGRYTLPAARFASRVISLEPDPENFALLEANVRLNGFRNVTLLRIAASDRAGSSSLQRATGPNRGTSSLRPPEDEPGDSTRIGETVTVLCDTLDHILEPFGLDRIDWLKIDVEGHERQVLAGARKTLALARHLVLEVANGNEATCRPAIHSSGLRLVAEEAGVPASNWLIVRAA